MCGFAKRLFLLFILYFQFFYFFHTLTIENATNLLLRLFAHKINQKAPNHSKFHIFPFILTVRWEIGTFDTVRMAGSTLGTNKNEIIDWKWTISKEN
jgi:hypothetical protein